MKCCHAVIYSDMLLHGMLQERRCAGQPGATNSGVHSINLWFYYVYFVQQSKNRTRVRYWQMHVSLYMPSGYHESKLLQHRYYSTDITLTMQIKFYFDVISPYAWLAWRPLLSIAERHNADLVPVPTLFAGLLHANGQLGPAEIPNKRLWLIKDVMRRAASHGLSMSIPPYHPFNPLLALRVASLDMSAPTRRQLTGKLLDAAWLHGKDISNCGVVSDIVYECGLNGSECITEARDRNDIKKRLKFQTEEALSIGAFGVPTIYVNNELFWGSESDTMAHIEAVLEGHDSVNVELLKKWTHTTPSASRRR